VGTDITPGDDGMPAELVHEWVVEKHAYLRAYVEICDGPRAKTDRPAFIDPFCSCGRSKIIESREFVDGSPMVAWKACSDGKKPFHKIYVADLDKSRREACVARLLKANAPVEPMEGDAISAVRKIISVIPPAPLHLAFLDPHSLGDLDFSLIKELSKLERVDLLIHVSVMDMQRNLMNQVEDEDAAEFDAFAPGWRSHVGVTGSQQQIRTRLLRYWQSLVGSLRFVSRTADLIKGPQGQRLYWLILLTRHDLGDKLWRAVLKSTPSQKSFGF
jgi:three-Cys-motif partner protein